MKKETDLDGVKSVATTLLFTDYHKTEMSPAIVQHPFTNMFMSLLLWISGVIRQEKVRHRPTKAVNRYSRE